MPRPVSLEYREGELELILSLAPTSENIQRLARVLGRSESALQIVYRAAFGHSAFPEGKAFNRKVLAAKKVLGIAVGRRSSRQPSKEKRVPARLGHPSSGLGTGDGSIPPNAPSSSNTVS